MDYPNLRRALDLYSKNLQNVYKSNVQVDTGALRKSIKVWCDIDGKHYQLHINLRYYWKWIRDTFPWQKALVTIGLPEIPGLRWGGHSFGWDTGRRYPIDWKWWQDYVNLAFERDMRLYLEGAFDED